MNKIIKFIKSLFFLEIVKGLKITGRKLSKKPITIQYPEEKTPLSSRFRGLHALRKYPNGEERCIGCKLCEAVCPALAISMDTEVRSDNTRRTTKYEIDLFEYHFERRKDSVMNKTDLLKIGDMYEKEELKDREKNKS